MNRLTTFVKKIRLTQILTVFLAGIFLFLGTACNNTPKVLAKTADQIREEVPSGAVTSEFKGGMNSYSDVDPRTQNVSETEAKAKLLKDAAERRITTKSSNDVSENIQRVGEEGQDKLDAIGQKMDENKDAFGRNVKEFAENTKQGIENIKDNARDGVEGAKKKVEEGASTLKTKVSQGTENVKRAADQATDKMS